MFTYVTIPSFNKENKTCLDGLIDLSPDRLMWGTIKEDEILQRKILRILKIKILNSCFLDVCPLVCANPETYD